MVAQGGVKGLSLPSRGKGKLRGEGKGPVRLKCGRKKKKGNGTRWTSRMARKEGVLYKLSEGEKPVRGGGRICWGKRSLPAAKAKATRNRGAPMGEFR